MIKSISGTRFYLNNELVDVEMLEYENRKPNGGSNHRRGQAICKLKLLANELLCGYETDDENLVYKWLREASK